MVSSIFKIQIFDQWIDQLKRYLMRSCIVCEKSPASGRKYKRRGMEKKKGGAGSKVVGKSFRMVLPNLQRIKITLNGTVQRALVCTSCIKANKVTRAA